MVIFSRPLILAGLLLTWPVATLARSYYGEALCAYDDFQCLEIKPQQTWESLYPNPEERDLVRRLNRTNTALSARSWIVVPTRIDQVDLFSFSPFPLQHPTTTKKLIIIDLSEQAFGAYNADGKLVHWGPMSGGKGYCADTGTRCRTVLGQYRFYRKQGSKCVSSKFPLETNGGAKMPYCMHFYRGYAMHASNLPGYHASHGCVRVFHDDAKWLNREFVDIGTKIHIQE